MKQLREKLRKRAVKDLLADKVRLQALVAHLARNHQPVVGEAYLFRNARDKYCHFWVLVAKRGRGKHRVFHAVPADILMGVGEYDVLLPEGKATLGHAIMRGNANTLLPEGFVRKYGTLVGIVETKYLDKVWRKLQAMVNLELTKRPSRRTTDELAVENEGFAQQAEAVLSAAVEKWLG
ncbi:MAG: hypothetical protein A2901_00015 [Elusimicrobia bacterium RIFCSPLOWO2_01_FULL_54_10]|nr:MAG: hypothetical protein A2901_00015 [Elusimicrobia bacterium RIFCSPLOWO2_01_FULL_54_10]